MQIPVPVRYEMKGYNSLLGSHYDHYYLNYDQFTWDNPSPDVFQVENRTYTTDYGYFIEMMGFLICKQRYNIPQS